MKQGLTNWRFIGTIAALVYSVVLFTSCRFGPVFSGDTIQYLHLAQKIKIGEWPASEKWLQFYPILISIVDFFFNDLIFSALVVNAILLSVAILVLNYLVYKSFNDYKLNLLLCILLLADRELYFHSMSIMAEICLLTLLLVLYLFIFKIIERFCVLEKKYFILIVVFSALMLFTKFNAIIAFVVVSYFIYVYSDKKIYWTSLYLFIISFLYVMHALIFNTNGVFVNNFETISQINLTVFIQGFHQYTSILIEYFTSPFLGASYLNIDGKISIVFLMVSVWYYVSIINRKGTKNHEFMILSFILMYVFTFIIVAKSSKGAQIDLRQFFIPAFLLNIGLLLKLYQWKSKSKYLLIAIILLAGSFKSIGRFQAFNEVGYGDFNASMDGWRDFQVIKAAKEKIASNGIVNSAINSNKYKSLGIDFGFIELGKPPTLGYWTDEGFKAPTTVDFKQFYKEKIIQNNEILIYVLDDFREIYDLYENEADTEVQLQLFADGFIIFKRADSIINPQTSP